MYPHFSASFFYKNALKGLNMKGLIEFFGGILIYSNDKFVCTNHIKLCLKFYTSRVLEEKCTCRPACLIFSNPMKTFLIFPNLLLIIYLKKKIDRSEAQTPESNQSTVDENESFDHSMLDDDKSMQDSPPSIISSTTGRPRNSSNNDSFKRNCGSYRSLDRLSRGPGRVSVWSDKITKQIAIPFKGSISSQLMCEACHYKSVVKVDNFDSITLNLPEKGGQILSLGQLLGDYVTPETVTDVECESCNHISNHNKTITFTKLPPCLVSSHK